MHIGQTCAPRGRVASIGAHVQPFRGGGGALDGRWGRCVVCGEVHAFCGSCAALGACCLGCAPERRRAKNRHRNRAWSRTPKGRRSNRHRQARSREKRRRVTDAILPEALSAPTPPSPLSSTSEPTREKASVGDGTERIGRERRGDAASVMRCARCGRVLSGRVRPSEWTPPRRTAVRAARPPRGRAHG